MKTGGREVWGDLPAFWGIGGVPAALVDPDDVIFIASVLENDDGDPQILRLVIKVAIGVSLMSTVALPRAAKVGTLLNDITSAMHVPTGVPNFDDPIGGCA